MTLFEQYVNGRTDIPTLRRGAPFTTSCPRCYDTYVALMFDPNRDEPWLVFCGGCELEGPTASDSVDAIAAWYDAHRIA